MKQRREPALASSTLAGLSRCAAVGKEHATHGLQISREVVRTRGHPSRLMIINKPSITQFQPHVEPKDSRKPTKKEYPTVPRLHPAFASAASPRAAEGLFHCGTTYPM